MNGCGSVIMKLYLQRQMWTGFGSVCRNLLKNISQNYSLTLKKRVVLGAFYPPPEVTWELLVWIYVVMCMCLYTEVDLLLPDQLRSFPGPWTGPSLHPSFTKSTNIQKLAPRHCHLLPRQHFPSSFTTRNLSGLIYRTAVVLLLPLWSWPKGSCI